MHSDKLFKKSYQPDAIADLGVPHRINIGYCEGEHCYNHYAIPKDSGMGKLKVFCHINDMIRDPMTKIH